MRRRLSPASASPTCASCKAAGTASQLRLGGLALGAPLDGGLDLRLEATEGLDQLPLVDHRHVQHLDQQTVAGHRQYLGADGQATTTAPRSEEHTSELQSLMRNSYAVFCLKKKKLLMLRTT